MQSRGRDAIDRYVFEVEAPDPESSASPSRCKERVAGRGPAAGESLPAIEGPLYPALRGHL
jgi:hypothetical protein